MTTVAEVSAPQGVWEMGECAPAKTATPTSRSHSPGATRSSPVKAGGSPHVPTSSANTAAGPGPLPRAALGVARPPTRSRDPRRHAQTAGHSQAPTAHRVRSARTVLRWASHSGVLAARTNPPIGASAKPRTPHRGMRSHRVLEPSGVLGGSFDAVSDVGDGLDCLRFSEFASQSADGDLDGVAEWVDVFVPDPAEEVFSAEDGVLGAHQGFE
jgi:hypothetical protein